MARPTGTSRINFDITQRLWDKLDMAAENPGEKREIIQAALERQLAHIPEPPADYQPKKKRKKSIMPLKSLKEHGEGVS